MTRPARSRMVSRSSRARRSWPLRCPLARAQRARAVADDRGGLAHRGLGQVGQLAGDALHRGLGLVALLRAAQLQLSRDRPRPAPGSAAPVPAVGPRRATGSLYPRHRACDLPDRLGQQPGVGRIRDSGSHDRRVGTDPVHPQQLRLRSLDQQSLVQRRDRAIPALGGDLHQRRRVRHPSAQRDAAEPLPRDRVGHLPTQRLVAQPVAELQKHQPQIGLHRYRRPTLTSVEERHERLEEHRVVQQHIHPRKLARHHQRLSRQDRVPQRRLVIYSSQHDGLDPF